MWPASLAPASQAASLAASSRRARALSSGVSSAARRQAAAGRRGGRAGSGRRPRPPRAPSRRLVRLDERRGAVPRPPRRLLRRERGGQRRVRGAPLGRRRRAVDRRAHQRMAELEPRLDDLHEARVLGRAERRERRCPADHVDQPEVVDGGDRSAAASLGELLDPRGERPLDVRRDRHQPVEDAGFRADQLEDRQRVAVARLGDPLGLLRRHRPPRAREGDRIRRAQRAGSSTAEAGRVEPTRLAPIANRSAPRYRRPRSRRARTRATPPSASSSHCASSMTSRQRGVARVAANRLSVAAPIANRSPSAAGPMASAPSSACRWRSGSSPIDPRTAGTRRTARQTASSPRTRRRPRGPRASRPRPRRRRRAARSCRRPARPRRPAPRCAPRGHLRATRADARARHLCLPARAQSTARDRPVRDRATVTRAGHLDASVLPAGARVDLTPWRH